ncbi:MAG TPA: AraC family transcriptional regulator [Halomonas sp.]|nr:AraC family transcriptional regulator [Halomonas sp.]
MVGDDADLPSRPVIEPRSYPDRVLSDRHSFHQLLLGLDGHVELDVEGRALRVSPGVLMPVASGDHHHYLAPGANRVLVLDLPENWCETLSLSWLFMTGGKGWRLPTAMRNRAVSLAGNSEILVDWLCGLSGNVGRRVTPPRLRLLSLLPMVRANLSHPWRIAELAAHCHLAEASFSRQFRALMGVSPYAWLVGERLQRARRLMLTTNALLTEVALACGFADAAHFSRVFREHHDASPRSWRNRHASGQISTSTMSDTDPYSPR